MHKLSSHNPLPWHGFHHIALATTDLDKTVNFYQNTLGMHVSEIFPSREGRGRHCIIFVKLNDEDTWGFHFFERANIGITPQTYSDKTTTHPLQHIALRLPNAEVANLLRDRLREVNVEIKEIPELGSFLFEEPNKLVMEVTYPQS